MMTPCIKPPHKTLRIHAMLPLVVDTLGPGNRAVIWVQGCTLHCPGCMVPETWDPDGGYPVDPSELAQQIAELPDIEGITVSGGEVFQQPEAAARFLTPLKAMGLNTWLYTGYTVEELVGLDNPHIDALLALTDVLVDGRFQEQGQSLCFRGSANQRIIPLTDALPLGRIDGIGETRMDITLDMHGRMMLVGIPPRGFLRSFRERMKVRGLTVATDNF